VALVVVAAAFGWIAYDRFFVREIPTFASDADHFKYGSIGNDGETGVPCPIWRALPKIFPEHLPGPGGYSLAGPRFESLCAQQFSRDE
jgi:hypothetical protein